MSETDGPQQEFFGLQELWKELGKLSYASWPTMVSEAFWRSLSRLISWPLSSVLTIFTIGITFLVFSVCLLIFQNLEDAIIKYRSRLSVTFYLRGATTGGNLEALMQELQSSREVGKVIFRDSEETAKKIRQELTEHSFVLEWLELDRSLPSTLEVFLDAGDTSSESALEFFANRYSQDERVKHVFYAKDLSKRLDELARIINTTGFLASAFMLLVSGFLVTNTIRLAMQSQQAEIEIMRLVGATPLYIKAPYLFEAALQGCLGAAISVAILSLGFGVLSAVVANVFELPPGSLNFLPTGSVALVLVLGLILGLTGAFFAMRTDRGELE